MIAAHAPPSELLGGLKCLGRLCAWQNVRQNMPDMVWLPLRAVETIPAPPGSVVMHSFWVALPETSVGGLRFGADSCTCIALMFQLSAVMGRAHISCTCNIVSFVYSLAPVFAHGRQPQCLPELL